MRVTYVCLYADSGGESHFRDVEVQLRETDFAPPAPPLNVSSFSSASEYGFATAPLGWHGDWHPTPQRQFLFYIAGEVEVGVSDGEVRTFGPGDIVLVEDTTGKGHVSRVLDSAEVLNAIMRLPG